VLAATERHAATYLPEGVFHVVSILASFIVISTLFAVMFKWLPDADVNWHDVWLGAVLTAFLFEGGNSQSGSTLGSRDWNPPSMLLRRSSSY
jgi:membrane protein